MAKPRHSPAVPGAICVSCSKPLERYKVPFTQTDHFVCWYCGAVYYEGEGKLVACPAPRDHAPLGFHAAREKRG
jgi:hypothetical protein